jgi:hypothetical protein
VGIDLLVAVVVVEEGVQLATIVLVTVKGLAK